MFPFQVLSELLQGIILVALKWKKHKTNNQTPKPVKKESIP